MKLLAVHPSALMYTRVFLRLEPLGLELVAAAARAAGHEVRIIDLQVETHRDYFGMLERWRPDAICFCGNYLANVPEVIDLAKAAKSRLPVCFVFVGGHSVSFIASHLLAQAEGAIDCVLRGEGEASVASLLDAARDGGFNQVPGAVTANGR
jgi:hopanoid C-3 methylase